MLQRVVLVTEREEGLQLMSRIDQSEVFELVGTLQDQLHPMSSPFENVPVFTYSSAPDVSVDLIIYSPSCKESANRLYEFKYPDAGKLPVSQFEVMLLLLNDKEIAVKDLSHLQQLRSILDNTHDGMIVIDQHLMITIFNKSAEKMTGISKEDAVGKSILEVMPNSQLPRVMDSGIEEVNQEQILANGTKIFTTRTPS